MSTQKLEKKKIKHVFTPEETAALNTRYRQSVKQVGVIEDELDSVKASYKAKVAEAEAEASTLDASLDAGFELREEECVVVFRHKERKKDYHLKAELKVEDGQPVVPEDAVPLVTETMTDEDLQIELQWAEGKFELKDEIQLFNPTETDLGILVVGRQNGKWFTALRAKVGGNKIEERLDGEQAATKKRPDAVAKAVKRFSEWLAASMGKEVAQGFGAELDKVKDLHKEREE